jgi:hypothetical protein
MKNSFFGLFVLALLVISVNAESQAPNYEQEIALTNELLASVGNLEYLPDGARTRIDWAWQRITQGQVKIDLVADCSGKRGANPFMTADVLEDGTEYITICLQQLLFQAQGLESLDGSERSRYLQNTFAISIAHEVDHLWNWTSNRTPDEDLDEEVRCHAVIIREVVRPLIEAGDQPINLNMIRMNNVLVACRDNEQNCPEFRRIVSGG